MCIRSVVEKHTSETRIKQNGLHQEKTATAIEERYTTSSAMNHVSVECVFDMRPLLCSHDDDLHFTASLWLS
jgi:hypothetical protein